MKKKVLVILLMFVILISLSLFFKDIIPPTKKIAGGIRVTVDMYPPDLIIDSPKNIVYSTNKISIKYAVSDSGSGVDTVWYNLDGGQNMTLAGDTAITVSEGDHTLYVYAKDIAGLVNGTESVTFSVSV